MTRKISLMTAAVFLLSAVLVVFAAVAPAVSYDYSAGKFKNLTTGMEYSTNGKSSWSSVTNINMSGAPGVTYVFRYKGETDENAYTTVAIPSSEGAPAGISYANGTISGVSSAMEYNTVSASNNVWTKCTGSTITVTLSASAQTYYIRKAATSAAPASQVTSVTVPAASVSNTSGIKKDFINEKFTGFGNDGGGWFYTTVSATYTGPYLYPVTASTTSMLPDSTYYFRKSGDSSGSAISTPSRPTAPKNLSYDAVTKTITGLEAGKNYRYSITKNATTTMWADLTSATVIPLTNSEQKVNIAFKATDSTFASHNCIIALWAKPGTDDAFDPVHYSNGKIEGVTAAMEYQVNTSGKAGDLTDDGWKACTGTELTITRGTSDQYVFIRLAAAGDGAPGTPIVITVPLSLPAPVVTLDIVKGEITGFDPSLNYVYRAGTSGTWKDIKDALISEDKSAFIITSLLKGRALTLQMAQKPGSGSPEAGSITEVKISDAPAKPAFSISAYYANDSGVGYATVTGIKAGMQYKLENDANWSEIIAADGDMSLPVGYTAATYIFRIAPKQDQGSYIQGSAEVKVKLAAPAKPPTVKVDYKKEQITLKNGMSYSLDGVTWTAVTANTNLSLPDNNLYGGTLMVRSAATAKKPASYITAVSVNPRIETVPTSADVFITLIKGKKTVVMRSGARQVEYLDANNKWKKGVPKYTDTLNTQIRFMTDTNYGPSESVVLTANGIS